MNLSSLASSALATTRSTFKGLAEAAVASGDGSGEAPARGTARAARAAEPASAAAGTAEASESKPKGVRRGTLLDAYA